MFAVVGLGVSVLGPVANETLGRVGVLVHLAFLSQRK